VIVHQHRDRRIVRGDQVNGLQSLKIRVVGLLLDDRGAILLEIVSIQKLTIFHPIDITHLITRRATGETNLFVIMINHSACERERERKRKRERQRERDRETERQRDRDRETERERQRERETERQRQRETDTERERQRERERSK
jgi:hypothetical protein